MVVGSYDVFTKIKEQPMNTSIIPITKIPASLNLDNVKEILGRVIELHPFITESGAKQYLCDLLNINKVEDLISDFVVFQNKEPAVTSEELHQLAERILPYNDNDLERAKFSVRNILNTTPKELDDLIDYTTESRKKDFIASTIKESLIGPLKGNVKITSIDQLSHLLADEPDISINIICNAQMDKAREVPFGCVPGITPRQKMLFNAANYYLNHKIGFKTNSAWIASFINSSNFGCLAGWLHQDGCLCHERHFGFKDDTGAIDLVMGSIEHIESLLASAMLISKRDNDDQGLMVKANLYIDTLISSLDVLLKKQIQHGINNQQKLIIITNIINNNVDLLSGGQLLAVKTINWIQDKSLNIKREYYNLLESNINAHPAGQEPDKYMMAFFDAWNFFVYDVNILKSYSLMPLFLQAKYYGDSLLRLSKIISTELEQGELPEQFKRVFEGFFTNFLFVMVNHNSDTHFLFDEILIAATKAGHLVDTSHVTRAMGELGHKGSMLHLSLSGSKQNKDYWERRIQHVA